MPISLKLFRFTKPSSRKTIIRTSLSGIPFWKGFYRHYSL
jgi:hypothetical protein